jgi:hypothetical protein
VSSCLPFSGTRTIASKQIVEAEVLSGEIILLNRSSECLRAPERNRKDGASERELVRQIMLIIPRASLEEKTLSKRTFNTVQYGFDDIVWP